MMLLRIAWRNVWRHRTRSSVIMVSVIFGLWAGLFINGYVNGMVEDRIKLAIEKEVSHLQVHHPGFKSDFDVSLFIPGSDRLLDFLSAIPEIKSFSGRVLAKGMLTSTGGTSGIQINGVHPESEIPVTHLNENIVQGTYFGGDNSRYLLIGEKLMQKLKLRLNSKVVLTLMDKDHIITSGSFRIKGVYKTKNTPFDESNVYIDRQTLTALTATPNELHEIAILLGSNESLSKVKDMIHTAFPALLTENWMEVAPEMDLVVNTTGQSMLIFMGIIMLALAFGIINTMLMAVLERTREIGMLMALGMNKLKVFLMILLETVFLVVSGAPVGMAAGFLTIAWFGRRGIDLSVYKEVFASFGYSEIIHPVLHARDYLNMLVLVVVTAILAALIPARKALSLDPSEAIRK